MRQNYNSFEYWKNFIMENRTIRGHMFMKNLPTDKSIYMHTLIFSKYGGLNSIWSYFPNIKVFIGYIQYSFLQEAFYTWINCKYGPIFHNKVFPILKRIIILSHTITFLNNVKYNILYL